MLLNLESKKRSDKCACAQKVFDIKICYKMEGTVRKYSTHA